MSDDAHSELRRELAELTRSARAWAQWVHDSGVDDLGSDAPARRGLGMLDGDIPIPHRGVGLTAPQSRERTPAAATPTAATPAAATPAAGASESARPATAEERRVRLAVLAEQVNTCTRCRLHETRNNTVFSRGSSEAELVFVGEGPGADEDRQGLPFVGAAGQLLDKMVAAMGYNRDDVYVCNVVKCRPPNNRKPQPDEMEACMPYLKEQLAIVDPKAIVGLGGTGVQGLIGARTGITRMRGSWKLYRGRWPLMPTFHPAYLLRQPEKKRDVWNDLKQVMRKLGKEPPTKK